MTIKEVSGRQIFVCGSSDNKASGVLLTAPAGSICYEFTTGTPDTVREFISFGGGVWGMRRNSNETST